MANWEHLKQIKQGVEKWNRWRHTSKTIQPDLSGADLRDVDLYGAFLYGVDLSRANLSGANLSYANLNSAYLIAASLSKAELSRADLSDAHLYEVNLSHANLSYANLNGTNVSNVDLSYAQMYRTNIAKTDLRTTKGLATIRHEGPSNIELFSVLLPQDGSALHFLRGAGVPDEWIDDYRTRMMQPIQYHSCFISYTNTDEMIAKRLYADLQAYGVRCWFAPEDLKIGDKFRTRINDAIHQQDKLLLVLSEDALRSEWVETEVEVALEKEKTQKRDVLFPIRLDESILYALPAWAEHLRLKRHIGDFTQWKEPENYQKAFIQLLRDLKP